MKNHSNKLIIRVFIVVNVLFAILLLFASLAPNVSPIDFWIAELFGYLFPFLAIINVLFVILWMIQLNRLAFISLFVLIIGYDKISVLYRLPIFVTQSPISASSIKIMSYNVRLFDLYNWSGNQETRSKIFELLKREQLDIVCFQEYYHSDDKIFSNNDTLKKIIGVKYSHIEYGLTLKKKYHWGLATFSKYPVVNKGILFFEAGKTNFGMFSDVIINKDTVRIYNVHLQSNHFKLRDYQFIDKPNEEDVVDGTHHVLSRIKQGVIKRTSQVEELNRHINNCKFPIVLCGDFNDPPFSYAYQTIKGDLNDAFEEKGKGFGISYNNTAIPYRIDYILHSSELKCLKYAMIRKKHSDHFPIVAWFDLETGQ